MTHLFLLTVLLNGQVVSEDMYFYSIYRCQEFSKAIVQSKYQYNSSSNSTPIVLVAYCIPKLADAKEVRVYK